jgi:drug/metabolite transporter (DMT)-like permease
MNDTTVIDSPAERRRAVAYLIVTAVMWSLGGILIKLVDWNPMAIAGTRSAIAGLFLLAVTRRLRPAWSVPQIGAALAYAGTVILFVVATKWTTSANAILLQYTSPIYVAIFAPRFLGERPRLIDWLTIAAVMSGMGLFFLDKLTVQGYWGNVCAVASAVTFAWFTLFMRKQRAGSPLESVILGNFIAAAIGLPFARAGLPDARGWGGLLILGVVQLGASYLFYVAAIKHVQALDAILISVVEPILNPIWVLILAGERPGLLSLVGGAIVVGSVAARGILGVGRSRARLSTGDKSS